jgi:hypothetical protein
VIDLQLHVTDIDLGFEVQAFYKLSEKRQHVRRHHYIHSSLNSAWTHPELQLDEGNYKSIRSVKVNVYMYYAPCHKGTRVLYLGTS